MSNSITSQAGEGTQKYQMVSDVQAMLGKRVNVYFGHDKSIAGILLRNPFINQTLCLDTAPESASYKIGKFFFEPRQIESICEI